MRTLCSMIFLLTAAQMLPAAEPVYDVVIYGGTSSGVAAAVQSARMGKSVVLIEPGVHLGGLTAGGLGATDSGDKSAIGGLSREFYQRLKKYYDQDSAWMHQKKSDFGRYRANDDAIWMFEPRIAEQTFEQMLAEEKVKVVKQQRLDLKTGVQKAGKQIQSITTESGQIFAGKMFIDATYEGDLMALAGVQYAVGRESNDQYEETLNGIQKKENVKNHRFLKPVDPYVVPGDPNSGLLPGVNGKPLPPDGTGDKGVQAYCFRMCMSKAPANRVPFPKPTHYDESQYELLFRNFEAGDLRLPLNPVMMPNLKTDTNNNCAVSTDYIGMNYEYPDAGYDKRAEIIRAHEDYQKGLMWSLANHPRVPETIRKQMRVWGLAKDEFVDNDNWPHQLYIREARRMIGEYVMTEHDCRRLRVAEDSVGLGSYNMDSHNVLRYIDKHGHVQNEGDVQVSPRGPYAISYRSIVPEREQCSNLLVPVCLSSSHIAYGSIRMEPVFMILGQSAATAAAIAIDDHTSVQAVPYQKLRLRLLADRQVLDIPSRFKPAPPVKRISVHDFPGIVLDDLQAEQTGNWSLSSSIPPFLGRGYLHDGHEAKGEKSLSFQFQPKSAGKYEVRVAYSANANRATNVPVEIVQGEVSRTALINQQKTPDIGGIFTRVATLSLKTNEPVIVTISNAKTDGYVIVDAVQLVPVKSVR